MKIEKNKNILIDQIVEKLSNGKVCILPTDTFYSLSVVADNSLAIKTIDWIPKRNLEEMCSDGWKWQKNNPEGFRNN